MVDQASQPHSIKKYILIGGIAVAAVVGVLAALSYMADNQRASQVSSTTGSNAAITGAIPTAISANPNPASKGGTVDVQGNEFSGSQTITLSLNGTSIKTEPSPLKTDDAGNFVAKITLPYGQTGNSTLTASEGSGRGASIMLSIK